MIVHDFSHPLKQLRIDSYCLCSMLTLVQFVFNWRLHIIPGATWDYFLINRVSEGFKKSKTFWASALIKVGAAQDAGSCIYLS